MLVESLKHNFTSLYHTVIQNNENKINLVNGVFTTFSGIFSGAISNRVLYKEPLDVCALSVGLALNYIFFPKIPSEILKESRLMKIYRVGCFTLGFLYGFLNLNVVKTAMYAQVGLLLIDKISSCNFQNLISQINSTANLKKNFNKVVQKSIEIYPHVKERFIFIFGTPSEEERVRKAREWRIEYLQILKNDNSKNFDQLEKLKIFIQNDPELYASYLNSLKNTLIFMDPYDFKLEIREDKLSEELSIQSSQCSFLYNFKRCLKDLLKQNPDFSKLFQIKLMQRNLNKNQNVLKLKWQ